MSPFKYRTLKINNFINSKICQLEKKKSFWASINDVEGENETSQEIKFFQEIAARINKTELNLISPPKEILITPEQQ